jgi:nucleotide-binding universal stress UspA family protein
MTNPTLNSPPLVFTFRPSTVNNAELANPLKTAKMLATKLGSELVATSISGEGHPEWSKDFQDASGEDIWTHFITRDETSHANAAVDLVSDKSLKHAEAIVVVTHLPKSPVAKLIRHFMTNLLSVTKYPVIAISAKSPALTDIKKILFITDLSKNEKQQYRRALKWAKKLEAEIVIGNCLLSPWELDKALSPGGISVVTTIDDQMMKDAHEAHQTAKVWINEASDVGVRASFEHVTGHLSVSSGMLEAAENLGADLIVVSRKNKSQLVATTLGSTLMEILGSSSAPVLVFPAISDN